MSDHRWSASELAGIRGYLGEREAREDGGAPARCIGRYRIVREVGRGGMGIVYEATDSELDRRVALKVLRDADATPELLTRLHREARAAGSLDHPGLVSVHEVGRAPGPDGPATPYIAMSFVDGPTLDVGLETRPLAENVRLLHEVAEAVGHAHAAGVVHRDLKPSNILIGADGRAVVVDFGLARLDVEEQTLTRSGTLVGTAGYMSPEQALGRTRSTGPPSDVWALGVLLYRMLSGRMPHAAPSLAALLANIESAPPARPRSAEPDLEAICLKALEKPPGRRYPDASAMAADLQRWREGRPVEARTPSVTYRLARWLGRHRLPVVVALVGVLAVASVAVWQHRRTTRATDVADAQLIRARAARERLLVELDTQSDLLLDTALELRRAGLRDKMQPLLERTEALCRRVMAEVPDSAEPHYRLGRMYRAQLRFEEAERAVNRAVELDPAHLGARWERVILTGYRIRMRELELLDGLARGAAGKTLAESQVRGDGAYRRFLSDTDSEARALKARMIADLDALGASDEATVTLGQAALLCARGIQAAFAGRDDDATALLERAVRADPSLVEAHEALAELELDWDECEAALKHIARGLAVDGGYSPLIQARAQARTMTALARARGGASGLTELELALADMDTLVALVPDAAVYRRARGVMRLVLDAMRPGEPDVEALRGAIADLDHALELGDARALGLRGIARTHCGAALRRAGGDPSAMLREALEDLDAAVGRDGPSQATLQARSRARLELAGRDLLRPAADPIPALRLGLADADRIIAIDATWGPGWHLKGWSHYLIGAALAFRRQAAADELRAGEAALLKAVALTPTLQPLTAPVLGACRKLLRRLEKK